jgi:hypothetical protein
MPGLLWCILVLLAVAVVVAGQQPGTAQGDIVVQVVLTATGAPAREPHPACAPHEQGSLARLVSARISSVMDHYIGYPVLHTVPTVSPDARQWLHDRLGHTEGHAACANLCGIVSRRARVQVCAQDHRFGRACLAPGTTGEGPLPFSLTGPLTREASPSGRSEVVCVHVKQWSQTLQRTFTLESEP